MSKKELAPKPLQIKKLPAKQGSKELTPDQPSLDLGVEREIEVDGIGMGVLSDGTPYLTGRGLARLVGMENLHIRTIGIEWNETPPKPRIEGIKKILSSRGVELEAPFIAVRNGEQVAHAFPDAVCLAVLEYYAFDAHQPRDIARKNFRLLAGKSLRDFIYTQVGYDPNNELPEVWRVFHDRVRLTYNKLPPGYFGIFKEIADMIVTLGNAGLQINKSFLPDISVGSTWSRHWDETNLEAEFGARRKYEHNYPDYFPQAASNPQPSWCYPEAALGEFRRWFRDQYIGEGKFKNYLANKVRLHELPASFTQLALAAYKRDPDDEGERYDN